MNEKVNLTFEIEGLDERVSDEMLMQIRKTIRRVSHEEKRKNVREPFSRVRIAETKEKVNKI